MKDVDGTLLKIGDEIERVDYFTAYYPKGYRAKIIGYACIIRDGKDEYIIPHLYWRKAVSAVPKEEIKNPIVTRTVTTTELISGNYGKVNIGGVGRNEHWNAQPYSLVVEVSLGFTTGYAKLTADDLIRTSTTLLQIAEYLKEKEKGG